MLSSWLITSAIRVQSSGIFSITVAGWITLPEKNGQAPATRITIAATENNFPALSFLPIILWHRKTIRIDSARTTKAIHLWVLRKIENMGILSKHQRMSSAVGQLLLMPPTKGKIRKSSDNQAKYCVFFLTRSNKRPAISNMMGIIVTRTMMPDR